MDILKTLTRSTRRNSRSSSTLRSALPSAGTNSNPQLFEDPVGGKKRKREGELKDADSPAIDAGKDLEFFSPKHINENVASIATRTPVSKNTSEGKPIENKDQLPTEHSQSGPEPRDHAECRRILKSHRLKVTVLSEVQVKPKKKKSKKQRTEVSKESQNGTLEQLFPQPLTDFAELRSSYAISSRLYRNISNQGYTVPTEVQIASLPLLLRPDFALASQLRNGSDENELPDIDLLAVAPTGSGKTLAFLIPIINSMLHQKHSSKTDGIQAIVVAPTKELASQIVNEGRKLCLGTGIKIVGMQKGMRVVDASDETENLSSTEESHMESGSENDEERGTSRTPSTQPVTKANILVTTPLRLRHALSHATKPEGLPLPSVRHLVLDEADVLLDPLFREQTLGIWGACNNPQLQTTLWSATMGSNIEALAVDTIQARKKRVGQTKKSVTIRLVVGLKDTAVPNIEQRLVYAATEQGKLIALRQLLHPAAPSSKAEQPLRPPFLVFTQTIPRATALHSELQYDIPLEAGGSCRLAVLHSDLSDAVRAQIMTRFRNGEIWILITTDILSRGVDFKGINGVVNYDIPNSAAAYIHRVGRTGRAGRNGGIAVTYYTKEDLPYVKSIANIIAASERQAGKTEGEGGVKKWLLAALPTPSKEGKKALRKRGVEARSVGTSHGSVAKTRMRITTKSGYDRRRENNRRGAIEAGRRHHAMVGGSPPGEGGDAEAENSEWDGFDDE